MHSQTAYSLKIQINAIGFERRCHQTAGTLNLMIRNKLKDSKQMKIGEVLQNSIILQCELSLQEFSQLQYNSGVEIFLLKCGESQNQIIGKTVAGLRQFNEKKLQTLKMEGGTYDGLIMEASLSLVPINVLPKSVLHMQDSLAISEDSNFCLQDLSKLETSLVNTTPGQISFEAKNQKFLDEHKGFRHSENYNIESLLTINQMLSTQNYYLQSDNVELKIKVDQLQAIIKNSQIKQSSDGTIKQSLLKMQNQLQIKERQIIAKDRLISLVKEENKILRNKIKQISSPQSHQDQKIHSIDFCQDSLQKSKHNSKEWQFPVFVSLEKMDMSESQMITNRHTRIKSQSHNDGIQKTIRNKVIQTEPNPRLQYNNIPLHKNWK